MADKIQMSRDTIECLRKHLTAISGILGIDDFEIGGDARERKASGSKLKESKSDKVMKYKDLLTSPTRKLKPKHLKNGR